MALEERLLFLIIILASWSSWLVAGFPLPKDVRTNTTAHLIFNTVSSLLQHWPNTIYRNGHTFVPATIPAGTSLYHGRMDHNPPSSPEFFAFDPDHSYVFCFGPPCFMFTYVTNRDLRLGYFDGTSACTLPGCRDFQDVLFNGRLIPRKEYNPWEHAGTNMCTWAKQVGLDGIVRMEPSFEAIICNIDTSLGLISKLNIVHIKHAPFYIPRPGNVSAHWALHPRLQQQPYFPLPTIPTHPPPPGWKGTQRDYLGVWYESMRAGMWHNRAPGESRIVLDYAGIVSAYEETYTSLVASRQGVPRFKHRVGDASADDWNRLKADVHDVLTRERSPSRVNWPSLFQACLDRYAERLEHLRYILRQANVDPVEIMVTARERIMVIATPYLVLPQANSGSIDYPSPQYGSSQRIFREKPPRSEPDDDWFDRIYDACVGHATDGVLRIHRVGDLTAQERNLLDSINRVQSAICSSIVYLWTSAFDSEDHPVFASELIANWKVEVEELMEWLDWHMWVKCKPPCGEDMQCVLRTWPWEVMTGEEDLGPTCRNKVLSSVPSGH